MKKVVIIPYEDYWDITEELKVIYNVVQYIDTTSRDTILKCIDEIEKRLYNESED